MSRKRSGWKMQHAIHWVKGPEAMRMVLNLRDIESEPSRWDKLLRDLGMLETDVLAEIKAGTHAGQTVRTWISRHQHIWFVPEQILQAMGIPTWL